MQIYNVGPREFSEYQLDSMHGHDCRWLVYWYQYDCFLGTGELVALGMDGLLHCKSLGHCSCFGPLERWDAAYTVTVEEFLRTKKSIHDLEFRPEIELKVRSLLSTLSRE